MPTVLVVDDEWAIADWLKAVISDVGCRVLVASNGKAALLQLENEPVDLVIADYMMPAMDGPALVAAMREKADTAAIPVIVMTALPESSVRERLRDYIAYLRKPFRETDLLAALSKALPSLDP